jgi:ribonuclease J
VLYSGKLRTIGFPVDDAQKLTRHEMANLQGLYFLPLGGCGEIGMNLNLYHCDGQWLMVDNGITFCRSPEAVLMTDIRAWLDSVDLKTLQGLVITHAHEDHVGAAAYLWGLLRCPIYATPFTVYILREKLKEVGIENAVVHELPLSSGVQLGHFGIEFVSLTHSVPEPNALVIRTPHGNIFHTGDWKIDSDPLIGAAIDHNRMQAIGDEGILALVCDSTNVFEEGESGSEGRVREVLHEVIAQSKGRIVLSCFSSNLARIKSTYDAAIACGRKVCLLGRSLRRMVDAARHCGYLPETMTFVEPREVRDLPANRVLILTTGSQAEPRAALTLMSMGKHREVILTNEDTVIFSSRVIPGNQEAISELQNRLVLMGVNLMKYREGLHVSGHPCRDELRQMYRWLRPQILIPVHGEDIHIKEHALFGKAEGIPESIRPHNGQMFRFQDGKAKVIGLVPTGRLALDGRRLVEDKGRVMEGRRQLLNRGIVFVHCVISRKTNTVLNYGMASEGVFESYEEERKWEEPMVRVMKEVIWEQLGDPAEEGSEPAEGVVRRSRDLSSTIGAAIQSIFERKWKIRPFLKVRTSFAAQSSGDKKRRRGGQRRKGSLPSPASSSVPEL